MSCYTRDAGTPGIGACRSGVQQCVGGSLGPCIGEVGPAAESCNGEDDDCDGTADEVADLGTVTCGTGACAVTVNACTNTSPTTCTPGTPGTESCNGVDDNCNGAIDENGCCTMHVSPAGNDANPGTAANPKLTINAAITAAVAAGGQQIVCVAGGTTTTAAANFDEAVVMKNNVSVLGGYQATGNFWPRNTGTIITRIRAQNATGVLFDSSVTAATVLDGFTITGSNSGAQTAALTIDGSTGARVSNNIIIGGGAATSYGVHTLNGATPVLQRNIVSGGTGSQLSVGIYSSGASPQISSHCAAVDSTGHCTSFACGVTPSSGIRGRNAGSTGTTSIGVLLESSPGAIVSQSSICGGASNPGSDSVGVLIRGNAAGTQIRTSNITGNVAARNSVGVWLEPCGGAAPWLFDNTRMSGSSNVVGARGDGVRAVGDCHPRIDGNIAIIGGEEGSNAAANGIFCARDADAGISAQCTVLGNTNIRGSSVGYPPIATGVNCDVGACARIENNALITGQQGINSIGVSLNGSSVYVNNNVIHAGCANGAQGIGAGLISNGSAARVENNIIEGSNPTAACPANALNTFGVLSTPGANLNELDLHSNDIFAGRAANLANCVSRAITFDLGDAGTAAGGRGIVRNNILHGGSCATSYGVEEANAAAEPRIVENNDLWGAALADGGVALTALYRDENATNLITASAVNALTDATAAANFSADPLFTSATNRHLQSGSPCRNTGTNTGCPATDVDGDARPKENVCDVGADEYVP